MCLNEISLCFSVVHVLVRVLVVVTFQFETQLRQWDPEYSRV